MGNQDPLSPHDQNTRGEGNEEESKDEEGGASVEDEDNNDDDEAEEEDYSEHEDESPPKPVSSTGIILSTGTSLSVEEWEDLKKKDPVEALQARLSGKTSSGSKPRVSTTSAGATSATSTENLLQELRTHVLEVDVFQAVESDHMVAFHIKELLQKLDTPNVSETLNESVNDFVLAFKPLLDQIATYIKQKKEHDALEDRVIKRKTELESTVNASQERFTFLKAQSEAEMKEIDDCQLEIEQHQKTIAELQLKILAAQARQTELQKNLKDRETLKAKIEGEASICLKHLSELDKCKASVEKLDKEAIFLDKKLIRAKTMLAEMKAKLDL